MEVIKVVQVDADAYVAIVDEAGAFLVDGRPCRIANAMPAECGSRWRESFLRGEIAHERWVVQTFRGEVNDFTGPSKRDTRAVTALGASVRR